MAQQSIRSISLAALFLLAACAGPLAPSDPNKTASKTLSAEGGSVMALSGAGVSIPAGALGRPTLITVNVASPDHARPLLPTVGDMYEFGPEGLTLGVPATVKLVVDIARLPAGYSITDVVMLRAPLGSSQFVKLPTRVIDATHVEGDTSHFSVFVPALDATRASTDAGDDGGMDGGACADRCASPNDGGAQCECSRVCGNTTLEIQCSAGSPLGCACVRNGIQVGYVTSPACPGTVDLERLCGFSADGGMIDAGIDAGIDGGTDGGRPDGGMFDGGTDGGRPDGGMFDGGTDGGRPDGGMFDGGTDGGRPDGGMFDGGTDGGRPDGGIFDGGTDGGRPDGGSDGGVPFDGGTPDGGSDGGVPFDGGTPDGGSDGGVPFDGGTPDGGSDGGVPLDGGTPDGGSDGGVPFDGGSADAG